MDIEGVDVSIQSDTVRYTGVNRSRRICCGKGKGLDEKKNVKIVVYYES